MGAHMDAAVQRVGWIGFLSDYGLSDGFVGVCHGVIAGLAPSARVIDICHEVPPGDLRRGAALLAQAAPFMPAGVLLAVVDPGVGTRRRAVVVRAGRFTLVGPDNGLLLAAARAAGGAEAAFEISSPRVTLPRVSATFHGRDVFAPTAARLAGGLDPARVGPEVAVADLVHLPESVARLTAHRLEGEVVTIDRFGNVQTSLSAELLAQGRLGEGETLRLHCRVGEIRLPLLRTFGDVEAGAPVGFVDSAGLFAVALNGRSAAEKFGLHPGDPVAVRLDGQSTPE